MDITVLVAAHKPYRMPNDPMYLPVHVGAEGKKEIGFTPDSTGENISSKNPYFCELTGLYWGWKNLQHDYLGLAHYRRHFTCKKHVGKSQDERFSAIMTKEELEKLLQKADVVLPRKRNYYIENLYSHYEHTMYVEPLDKTREVIADLFPDYLDEFDLLHKRTSAHMFNMFVMKKEILDQYCDWLFSILFELEKRMDYKDYDSFHARFFGRISELLLDVWINHNGIQYAEAKVMDMEKVNWMKKGWSFVAAKLFGKKYGKSF